jgi:hypothetical protein
MGVRTNSQCGSILGLSKILSSRCMSLSALVLSDWPRLILRTCSTYAERCPHMSESFQNRAFLITIRKQPFLTRSQSPLRASVKPHALPSRLATKSLVLTLPPRRSRSSYRGHFW